MIYLKQGNIYLNMQSKNEGMTKDQEDFMNASPAFGELKPIASVKYNLTP